MLFKKIFVCVLNLFALSFIKCALEEEKLIKTLFKNYNKLIRPVKNSSDHVKITMDLVLLQLINVVSAYDFNLLLGEMSTKIT